MGRIAGPSRIRARLSPPGGRRPGKRVQPQPHCYRRRRPTDLEPALGRRARNVTLRAGSTRLPKDSVANVSQVVTIDRSLLAEHVGQLSRRQIGLVLAGLVLVLGQEQR